MIFKKGNWYRLRNIYHEFYYFEFREMIGKQIYVGDKYDFHICERYNIIQTFKSHSNLIFRTYYPYDEYVEIDFSEIINLLPDDYPDKIVYLRKKKIKILLGC